MFACTMERYKEHRLLHPTPWLLQSTLIRLHDSGDSTYFTDSVMLSYGKTSLLLSGSESKLARMFITELAKVHAGPDRY